MSGFYHSTAKRDVALLTPKIQESYIFFLNTSPSLRFFHVRTKPLSQTHALACVSPDCCIDCDNCQNPLERCRRDTAVVGRRAAINRTFCRDPHIKIITIRSLHLVYPFHDVALRKQANKYQGTPFHSLPEISTPNEHTTCTYIVHIEANKSRLTLANNQRPHSTRSWNISSLSSSATHSPRNTRLGLLKL